MNRNFIKREDLLPGSQYNFSEKIKLYESYCVVDYENSKIDENGYIQLNVTKSNRTIKDNEDLIKNKLKLIDYHINEFRKEPIFIFIRNILISYLNKDNIKSYSVKLNIINELIKLEAVNTFEENADLKKYCNINYDLLESNIDLVKYNHIITKLKSLYFGNLKVLESLYTMSVK